METARVASYAPNVRWDWHASSATGVSVILLKALAVLGGAASILSASLYLSGMAKRRVSPSGKALLNLAFGFAAVGVVTLVLEIVLEPTFDSFLWFAGFLVTWMVCMVVLAVIGATVVTPSRIRNGWHVPNGPDVVFMRPRSLLVSDGTMPAMSEPERARLDLIDAELGGRGLKLLYSEHPVGWRAHLVGPSGEDLDHTADFARLLDAAEAAYAHEQSRSTG